ncbi:MAG: aspartate kinase [Flavobacteriales bacterium]
MKVFKFGGASVKDASSIKNVSAILTRFAGQKIIIVVSAMGKTTNKLEEIVAALNAKDQKTYVGLVDELQQYHLEIAAGLFPDKHFHIFELLEDIFDELRAQIQRSHSDNHAFTYDQIVSLGELLSSRIVNAYLLDQGLNSHWLDARTVIRTDNKYQEGQVDWNKTTQLCQQLVLPLLEQHDILLTQGFIGHTSEGFTTTLGREGSDYSAGILAYCCDAKDVTIWKDVPGMLNADPKYFQDTQLLEHISFKEAIELSYYGASVIHPKTVQPLQQKDIPLYVKSFIDPDAQGTTIAATAIHDANIPSFIVKKEQVLITISSKDFSFIAEQHLSEIFERLSQLQISINIMQNSALNFSILVDRKKVNLIALQEAFQQKFHVKYNEGLELVTIRHYDLQTIAQMTVGKEVILEQRTRNTARFVLRYLD